MSAWESRDAIAVFRTVKSFWPLWCLLLGFDLSVLTAAAAAEHAAGRGDRAPYFAEPPPEWVAALGPYTQWHPDRTQLLERDSAAGDAERWKDVIGGSVFDTAGIAAYWRQGVVHLAIVGNFPNANVLAAGRLVAPADLALDLDGDGSLETAIILSDIRATGDKGVERSQAVRQGQVYRVRKWYRPGDILQHTYGEGWRWEGPAQRQFAQAAAPVWMAEGELSDAVQASVVWASQPPGGRHVAFVTIRSIDPNIRLDDLPVVWGTAVCGNDVIFAALSRMGDLIQTSGTIFDSSALNATPAAGPAKPQGSGQVLVSNNHRWNVPYDVAFGSGGASGSGGGSTGGGSTGGGGSGNGVPSGGGGPGSQTRGSTSGGGGSGRLPPPTDRPPIVVSEPSAAGFLLVGTVALLIARRVARRRRR